MPQEEKTNPGIELLNGLGEAFQGSLVPGPGGHSRISVSRLFDIGGVRSKEKKIRDAEAAMEAERFRGEVLGNQIKELTIGQAGRDIVDRTRLEAAAPEFAQAVIQRLGAAPDSQLAQAIAALPPTELADLTERMAGESILGDEQRRTQSHGSALGVARDNNRAENTRGNTVKRGQIARRGDRLEFRLGERAASSKFGRDVNLDDVKTDNTIMLRGVEAQLDDALAANDHDRAMALQDRKAELKKDQTQIEELLERRGTRLEGRQDRKTEGRKGDERRLTDAERISAETSAEFALGGNKFLLDRRLANIKSRNKKDEIQAEAKFGTARDRARARQVRQTEALKGDIRMEVEDLGHVNSLALVGFQTVAAQRLAAFEDDLNRGRIQLTADNAERLATLKHNAKMAHQEVEARDRRGDTTARGQQDRKTVKARGALKRRENRSERLLEEGRAIRDRLRGDLTTKTQQKRTDYLDDDGDLIESSITTDTVVSGRPPATSLTQQEQSTLQRLLKQNFTKRRKGEKISKGVLTDQQQIRNASKRWLEFTSPTSQAGLTPDAAILAAIAQVKGPVEALAIPPRDSAMIPEDLVAQTVAERMFQLHLVQQTTGIEFSGDAGALATAILKRAGYRGEELATLAQQAVAIGGVLYKRSQER